MFTALLRFGVRTNRVYPAPNPASRLGFWRCYEKRSQETMAAGSKVHEQKSASDTAPVDAEIVFELSENRIGEPDVCVAPGPRPVRALGAAKIVSSVSKAANRK